MCTYCHTGRCTQGNGTTIALLKGAQHNVKGCGTDQYVTEVPQLCSERNFALENGVKDKRIEGIKALSFLLWRFKENLTLTKRYKFVFSW